jgi:hypothetical protein
MTDTEPALGVDYRLLWPKTLAQTAGEIALAWQESRGATLGKEKK